MSAAVRRVGMCRDCGCAREIRAHRLCSTCYSRRHLKGYDWSGPTPTVRAWGQCGPCYDCGTRIAARFIRGFCRRCYLRALDVEKRAGRW